MTKLYQLVLVTLTFGLASACSDIGLEKQSLAVRAQQAVMIVYAQAIQQYPLYITGLYTTEFQRICVLKCNDGYKNEETDKTNLFNVTEMGFLSGKCLKIETQVGQAYFMFIQPQIEGGIGTNAENPGPVFVPDPVNSQNPVLPDTVETRAALEEYIYDNECVITREPEIEKEEGGEDEYEKLTSHPDEWEPIPEEEYVAEEETKNEEGDRKTEEENKNAAEKTTDEFENGKEYFEKDPSTVKSTKTITTTTVPFPPKRTVKTIVADDGKLKGPPKKIGLARAMRLMASSTGLENINTTVLPITTTSGGNRVSFGQNLVPLLLMSVLCYFI